MEMLELAKDFGVPIVLVAFFILQSKLREDRYIVSQEKAHSEACEREKECTKRIDALQSEVINGLTELVKESNICIRENTSMLAWMKQFLPKQEQRGDR